MLIQSTKTHKPTINETKIEIKTPKKCSPRKMNDENLL